MADNMIKPSYSPSASTENHFKAEKQSRKDDYLGKYKDAGKGLSEAEAFGTNTPLRKLQEKPLMAKGLKQVGG